MSRREPNDTSRTERFWALAFAAGMPTLLYVATASGFGHWLDAGEFTAAASYLDISHPPGHPLAGLWLHAFTYIPVGPLSLRVAVGSAIFAGIALVMVFRSLELTIATVGLAQPRARLLLTLFGTWTVAASYALWFQGVRPEVYALQALLVTAVVAEACRAEKLWPNVDARLPARAGLWLGLALANHHFLGLLVLPAIAPLLARYVQQLGKRPIVLAASAAMVGLSVYVYLPIRALADGPLNLGEPTTLSRFMWVVSAETFQGNQGHSVPQPLTERALDVLVQLHTALGWFGLFAALAGAYLGLRVTGARRITMQWVLITATYGGARAWLGFVRSNPDAAGYLVMAIVGMTALSCIGVALLAQRLMAGGNRTQPRSDTARGQTRRRGLHALTFALLTGLVASAGAGFETHMQSASLARFTDTDALDRIGRQALPTDAVLLVHNPQLIFHYWGQEAERRDRPDVTMVPIPLVTYPGMADRLARDRPELAAFLRSYLLSGALDTTSLQTLAGQVPLFMDLDPRVAPELYNTLVPHGLFHRVLGGEGYREDRQTGRAQQSARWALLQDLIGEQPTDRETQGQLLWHYFMSAVYYAQLGDSQMAARAVEHGLAINPTARELVALEAALSEAEDGEAIDASALLPGG